VGCGIRCSTGLVQTLHYDNYNISARPDCKHYKLQKGLKIEHWTEKILATEKFFGGEDKTPDHTSRKQKPSLHPKAQRR
jgi:hypothetical protein